MNIKTFFSRWSGKTTKKELLSQLDVVKDQLDTFTIVCVQSASEFYKKEKFVSEEAKKIEEIYKRQKLKGNVLDGISKALDTSSELINYLQEMVTNNFPEDITVQGWTLQTNRVAEVIEMINFMQEYAPNLVLYLLSTELAKKSKDKTLNDFMVKADINYITNNVYSFMNTVAIFNDNSTSIKTKLENIPNVNVNPDNADNVVAVIGYASADPLKAGFFSPRFNPFMFIGMRIAKYQANKYKKAQVELQEIQSKILKLRQLQDGREDAKLDKQIEYYSNLNNRIKADLEDMERNYDL